MTDRILKLTGGAAVIALVVAGAIALSGGKSTNSSTAAVSAAPAAQAMQQQQPSQQQQPQQQQGAPPAGFGTPVTGPTAAKVKAAALAKYPGTVERVMQLPDGLYVAHVIAGGGERHVLVSKDFQVIGTQTAPPGMAPDAGAPSGTPA